MSVPSCYINKKIANIIEKIITNTGNKLIKQFLSQKKINFLKTNEGLSVSLDTLAIKALI